MSSKRHGVLARLSLAALAVVAVGAGPAKQPALKSVPKSTCTTFADPQPQAPANAVEVTFLGVGGLLIRRNGQSVMTPPLYSNPTMGEVALSELYPDGERIDRLLHYPLSDLQAIIVGHSHYDHALDIPYIASKKASQARIYGSQTLLNILDPLKSSVTLKNAEERALCQVVDPFVDPCPPKTPTSCSQTPCTGAHSFDMPEGPAPRFRIWPIVSEHSAPLGPALIKAALKPLLGDILVAIFPVDPVVGWRGQLLAPARTIPTRAGDWTGGTVLAYVIDVLDNGGDPIFRIYYQDSPTRKPIGYPPCCLLDKRPVDLALLCAGGATEKPIAGHFPADIVKELRPRFVMAEHWEDLFNPRVLPLPGKRNVSEEIRAAPGVDPERFKKDVKKELPPGGRVTVPCPEDVAYFVPDQPDTWKLHANTVGLERWTDPKQ